LLVDSPGALLLDFIQFGAGSTCPLLSRLPVPIKGVLVILVVRLLLLHGSGGGGGGIDTFKPAERLQYAQI